MKIIEAVVVILIVALGASLVLNYSLYTNNQQLSSEFNNLNDTLSFPLSTSTTNESLGLNFTMAMNTTLFQSGQGINITVIETDALNTTITINASYNWQLPSLWNGTNPCNSLPIGLEIFKGYYTSSNILTAEPLSLYYPGIYFCPAIPSVFSYTFQPLGNNSITTGITTNGYWAVNLKAQTAFNNFTTGIYTVAGGDEWGQLVLLHFTAI
jgi:hypothetical protein